MTNNDNTKPLIQWLQSNYEELIVSTCKPDNNFISKSFDFIISYNYKYIIPKSIIKYYKSKIINLHISYLPYNRGSDPNFWSFIEDTPKGVSIHYIDEGIDTGNIILQKEFKFDESIETLTTTYNFLHKGIQNLFKEKLSDIINNYISSIRPISKGTYHKKSDFLHFYNHYGNFIWNMKINELKILYSKYSKSLIE